MSALDELKKVIRYYEEDKVNPSTAKNQISGETLKELDAHIATLQARLTVAEAQKTCTGCGTKQIDAIVAVINGGAACCPDCSTLTVDERNAIRVALGKVAK